MFRPIGPDVTRSFAVVGQSRDYTGNRRTMPGTVDPGIDRIAVDAIAVTGLVPIADEVVAVGDEQVVGEVRMRHVSGVEHRDYHLVGLAQDTGCRNCHNSGNRIWRSGHWPESTIHEPMYAIALVRSAHASRSVVLTPRSRTRSAAASISGRTLSATPPNRPLRPALRVT